MTRRLAKPSPPAKSVGHVASSSDILLKKVIVGLPSFDLLPDSAFVRLPVLQILFACSRATLWRWVRTSQIPAPKKIGPRISAWNVGELRQALAAHMGKGE